ncbi:AAA family ATPase [Aureimonas sp. AU40]|uniref:AAA family ATPase n=1 Tax=Aureimonas sp. AU40 TaxID=1637747 RepID=UPI000784EA06|nr:AAA family ATPase [Aureimonas sp. AU40]
MKFPEIEISNFLAITEAKLALSDRGLVLIQGENRDDTSALSNGAGKSSLFDALCWAIYGVTAREATGDDVINDAASKGTRVAVTLDDDGQLYTIARHRKHKANKNRVTLHLHNADGTLKDLTLGKDALTQVAIDKLIGCPLEVFAASIYAAQEKMPDLPAMTDKTLKLIVEEASGVTILEAALTKAREELRAAKIAHEDEYRRLGSLQSQINQAEADQNASDVDRDAWNQRQAAQVSRYGVEVREAVQAAQDAAKDRDKIDIANVRAGIGAVEARISSVNEEQTRLAELTRDASQAENQAEQHKRDALSLRDTFEKGQKKLKDVEHQVGCPCTSCGRDLTAEEIAPTKTRIQTEQNETKELYDKSRAAYQAAQKRTQELQEARDAFKATMTDLSASIASLAALREQERLWAALDTKVENAKRTAREAAQKGKDLAAETNPHDAAVERITKRIDTLTKEIAGANEKLKDLEEASEIASDVVAVFSPAGVRAHILDEVTPFLNQQTSLYLSSLSDGNIEATWTTLTNDSKGEAKEKFTIEVVNDKGGKQFKNQSGGEKRKVRLATALALQDLVARRASKPIELFIGDEIDDALDGAGLERLTTVLEEKARERGSVFVISHEDLKSWIPQQIRVIKENGKTSIVEEVG